MAVTSIVSLSESYANKRIDPNFYKPEYLAIEFTLTKKPNKRLLKQTEKINCGPFGSTLLSATYVPEGVPIVRPFNLTNMRIEGEIVYIPKEDVRKKGLKLFDNGDICFSRVGNIKFGIIFGFSGPVTISPNIIAAKIIKEQLNPHFLIAFLNTKYGYKQLERGLKVVAQPTINTADIGKIIVPRFNSTYQKIIEKLVLKAFKFQDEARNLYPKAETVLLEELGLNDFKPRYELSYSVNLSDAFSRHRIDAEYFQPAYESIIKKIKRYSNGFDKLLKYAENVNPNLDPQKYPEKTFSYIELADVDPSIGVINSVNEVKGEDAPSRARRMLREKDVIVSSVEGSLEKIALIDKEHNGCLASTGFFQFKPLNIMPEVLLILSKTIVLQSQLKKQCSGTILTAVPNKSVKEIIIPILHTKTQKKIALLVQQSHEARSKAKELLEIAKKAVEIAIEKNESESLNYISKFEKE